MTSLPVPRIMAMKLSTSGSWMRERSPSRIVLSVTGSGMDVVKRRARLSSSRNDLTQNLDCAIDFLTRREPAERKADGAPRFGGSESHAEEDATGFDAAGGAGGAGGHREAREIETDCDPFRVAAAEADARRIRDARR